MHVLIFMHKSVSHKNAPNPRDGIWGKVEKWGEGSESKRFILLIKVMYGNVGGKKKMFASIGLSSVPELFFLDLSSDLCNDNTLTLNDLLIIPKSQQ